jgi:hypothetical protein
MSPDRAHTCISVHRKTTLVGRASSEFGWPPQWRDLHHKFATLGLWRHSGLTSKAGMARSATHESSRDRTISVAHKRRTSASNHPARI